VSELGPTAEEYARFADEQARGQSPSFEAWARGVAADPEVLARIATLPPPKRQPNLVFAAARWHGVDAGPYAALRAAVLERWGELVPTILARATQTNEAARCATLLPVLARLPGPLALIEVGASAGLTLLPDRYSYRYTCDDGSIVALDPADGPSELVVECRLSGIRPPASLPEVEWRAGIDLTPVDVHDADACAWLETLVWPEHDDRRTRLRHALAIARREEVELVRGDLLEGLPDLVARAPDDATVVVYHSAVIAYLDDDGRRRFREMVESLPVRWVSNEAPRVFPEIAARTDVPAPEGAGHFLMALDGEPVGWAHGHGRSLVWIGRRQR
jgi:hypothetical protein